MVSLLSQFHKLPIIRIFDNLKLNLQYLWLQITRFDCIYILYLSVKCPFSILPNMAGFPVILNYFRHNGVFGTGKTPNSRAQRHYDKCFTSFKKWIQFLECSWNHENFGSLAKLMWSPNVHGIMNTSGLVQMNIPKNEFITYIYILYYQSSINFQFSPNLAGFPDILN